MLLKDKKVAIVGGGPGGLTLARLLQQNGITVKVYERDEDASARQQGATLDLHYDSGLKALREAGLIEEFKKSYRPGAERMTITDNNAHIHYTECDAAPTIDVNDEHARPEIDRGPLRDLLIASLHPDTIVWNSKFERLEPNNNGWDVFLQNGTTPYADLVIAADGANSKLRKYITDIDRIYSGATIVEGNIYNAAINAPHLWKLTNEGKVYALANGKSIVLSAKGEGSLSFYTSTYEREDWVQTSGIDFTIKEQVAKWFNHRFNDWSADWHEFFLSNDTYFIARPQYYFPVDQSWQSKSNITMIGDAAHASPPYGEGVNQAMLDALDLYEALGTEQSIAEAITLFEDKMLKRTAVITQESIDMMEALHADNNLQFMLDFFSGLVDEGAR